MRVRGVYSLLDALLSASQWFPSSLPVRTGEGGGSGLAAVLPARVSGLAGGGCDIAGRRWGGGKGKREGCPPLSLGGRRAGCGSRASPALPGEDRWSAALRKGQAPARKCPGVPFPLEPF